MLELPDEAVDCITKFLSESRALREKVPNGDRWWSIVYGEFGTWEECVRDLAKLSVTRDQAIGYMYQEQQHGRAL
jgi:hypothetical protein